MALKYVFSLVSSCVASVTALAPRNIAAPNRTSDESLMMG